MFLKFFILIYLILANYSVSLGNADCLDLVEEIKSFEKKISLTEIGFQENQIDLIIPLLNKYEANPFEIQLDPFNFQLDEIEQNLLSFLKTKYPYPKDWTKFIDTSIFPRIDPNLNLSKVLSITEMNGTRYLSFSGYDNRSIIRDIKRAYGGGKVEIIDIKGEIITRGTLDKNIGKRIKIVDKSTNPPKVIDELIIGLKKPKYKNGSLPQLETGPNQELKLIRNEELLSEKLSTLPRHSDAEIRQLEYLNDIFKRTPPNQRPSSITINTTMTPCESCYRVIKTFQRRYGIEINMKAKEVYLP